MTTTPPPGSPEAIALLCTCPVMDNQYGRGYRYVASAKTRLYVINADCPLHGSAREAVSPDGEKDEDG